jgi:branched-chain amino acid transport system ATP-binding protein
LPPLLELRAVTAGYGPAAVLHDIDLEVRTGEIVALLGGNGAGKTTTLRAISGAIDVRSGEIRFEGKVRARHDPVSAVRSGIAHCPQGRRIFPNLTVRENVELGSAILRSKSDRAAVVAEMLDLFPRLRERADQQGGTLSGGEQQMLAISRSLASRPRILMLDEPSLGLAPLVVSRVADLVKELRDRGMTILLVEQNAALALTLADRAYVLESGVVALHGDANELASDPRVRDAYLGSGRFIRRRAKPAVQQEGASSPAAASDEPSA